MIKIFFDRITTAAYDKGVEVKTIMKAFGIFLRDKVLEDAGMSHSDVDNTSPQESNEKKT